VNNRIPGPKLPDFYGTGALPLSYPNEWDKRNGRSGYGIWLHGTPSDNFSRPPLSSDGCVVLANPDLQNLYSTAEVGKTVVVISQHVQFVDKGVNGPAARSRQRHAGRVGPVAGKCRCRQGPVVLFPEFRSAQGENLSTWFGRQQKSLNGARFTSVKLRDVSLFRYPGTPKT
jgi:hypothetical protein